MFLPSPLQIDPIHIHHHYCSVTTLIYHYFLAVLTWKMLGSSPQKHLLLLKIFNLFPQSQATQVGRLEKCPVWRTSLGQSKTAKESGYSPKSQEYWNKERAFFPFKLSKTCNLILQGWEGKIDR